VPPSPRPSPPSAARSGRLGAARTRQRPQRQYGPRRGIPRAADERGAGQDGEPAIVGDPRRWGGDPAEQEGAVTVPSGTAAIRRPTVSVAMATGRTGRPRTRALERSTARGTPRWRRPRSRTTAPRAPAGGAPAGQPEPVRPGASSAQGRPGDQRSAQARPGAQTSRPRSPSCICEGRARGMPGFAVEHGKCPQVRQ
jgi:hypothetical protein